MIGDKSVLLEGSWVEKNAGEPQQQGASNCCGSFLLTLRGSWVEDAGEQRWAGETAGGGWAAKVDRLRWHAGKRLADCVLSTLPGVHPTESHIAGPPPLLSLQCWRPAACCRRGGGYPLASCGRAALPSMCATSQRTR